MMRNRCLPIFASLVLAGFSFSSAVPAGDGNYQNYIVGERAAGMGGAVTALATSVDSAYYNPAGLADVTSNSISLSASMYGFYNYEVSSGWWPGEDVDIGSFVTIPSTFGSIGNAGEGVSLGLAAFVVDRDASNDLEAFTRVGHYFKFNKDDQTIWIGPAGGFRVTPDLSLGLSLFFVYRDFNWFRDAFLGNLYYSISEDIQYSDFSLLGVLGAKYRLNDRWSVGLRIQTPNVHLTGSGDYLQKTVNWAGIAALYIDNAEIRNNLPTAITAGLGYSEAKKYAFGLDVSYHFPTGFDRMEGEDQFGITRSYHLRREGTVDVNTGAEYFIADLYPVRLGFFTDLSSAPDADVENPGYPAHIDKYGLTASIGRESENTTLNLGVNYVWGKGEALGLTYTRDGIGTKIVNAEESYLYIFLASSYLF